MKDIITNQKEIERKSKLKALKNYELSENYKLLKETIKDKKEKSKATILVAYGEKHIKEDEAGNQYSDYYTEEKKYNHKNKFVVGIEVMSEMMNIIDDSEGGKIIKDKIKEGIDNSEEHIGVGIVKLFAGSGGVVEYRYSDIDFTMSDLLAYGSQVAEDTIRVIEGLIEEYSKEAPQEDNDISAEVEDGNEEAL